MTIGKNKIDMFIFLLWVAFSTELLFSGFHKYSLYLIIPFLFVRSVRCTPGLFKNKYVKAYIVIMIWSLITCFTGINIGLSLSSYVVMGGGFMTGCILYSFAIKSKSSINDTAIFVSYIILFISISIYLFTTGAMTDFNISSDRIEGEHMNTNDIAYYLFACVISITAIVMQYNRNNSLFRVLLAIILILLNLISAVLTGSRQIIVVVLPMTIVSVLFILRKSNGKVRANNIVLLLGIVLIIVIKYHSEISEIVSNSFLMTRIHEEDVHEDARSTLLKLSFEVGLTHPILGVGTGCFASYIKGPFSHCTYLELFANSGFIPMTAYIYMVVAFIRDQWKRYRLTKDRVFYYLFFVGCFWAVYNFFYAFHTATWIIAFFFLLIGYSENKYRNYSRF